MHDSQTQEWATNHKDCSNDDNNNDNKNSNNDNTKNDINMILCNKYESRCFQ